jgi:hypothetical protein
MAKTIEQLEMERQELKGELAAMEGAKGDFPDRYRQVQEELAAIEAELKAAHDAEAKHGATPTTTCTAPDATSNPHHAPPQSPGAHPVAGGGDPIVLQATPAPAPPDPGGGGAPPPEPAGTFYGIEAVACDSFKGSLTHHVVSARIAPALKAASEAVRAAGGIITSSGGTRGLNAEVSPGRSATSFHYSGLAIDLYIYSGMQKPDKDPYVVVKEGQAGFHFRVYARAASGEVMTLTALRFKNTEVIDKQQYGVLEEVEVTDTFCDLTALFESHGLHPIGARAAFAGDAKKRQYMSAEWWHFQATDHLSAGSTTFGDVLKELYKASQLTNTPPWQYRNYVYNGDGGFSPKGK